MWRWLFDQLGLILTALMFATVLWAVATSEENPGREAFFPDPVPIETVTPTSLVVSQKSANSVRVRVRAPQASWDELKASTFRALVDVRTYGVGSYEVPIQVVASDPRVTVLLVEPSSLEVKLEPAKSRFLDARAEILDSVPLGYTFKPPTLSQTQVIVSGPASLVDQVSEVIAEVFLRGARVPVEREATLVARDATGKEIKGISISPSSIIVKITLEQRVGFKDVSIRTVLRGAVASGYWISNIVANPSTVTIVGNADSLARISGFIETAPIDVNNAKSDVGIRAELNVPEGVSVLNNDAVDVRISVTPILGGQTIRRKVVVQNLRLGLVGMVSPEQVDVIMSGPLPNLQNLPAETATVVVDAVNLGPGVYPLKPRVVGTNDPLRVQGLVPDTIQLTITDSPTPVK